MGAKHDRNQGCSSSLRMCMYRKAIRLSLSSSLWIDRMHTVTQSAGVDQRWCTLSDSGLMIVLKHFQCGQTDIRNGKGLIEAPNGRQLSWKSHG